MGKSLEARQKTTTKGKRDCRKGEYETFVKIQDARVSLIEGKRPA